MSVTEPSMGDIVAGFVEGTIVGVARSLGGGKRHAPGVLYEENEITVKRIEDHTDDLLHKALDLLEMESRLARDEIRDRDDLIRWVRESNRGSLFAHLHLRDHLIVASRKGDVEAMTFLTHYPMDRKAAMSYLVAKRRSHGYERNLNRATLALAETLLRFFKRLKPSVRYLLAEVDDPRLATTASERRLRCARLQVFGRLAKIEGTVLRVVDYPHLQPDLGFSNGAERQMLLAFIPFEKRFDRATMKSHELAGLLKWMYGRVSAEAFMTDHTRDKQCRDYSMSLLNRQLAALKGPVQCLQLDHNTLRRWSSSS